MTYNSIILEFKSPITLDQRLSFFYQFFFYISLLHKDIPNHKPIS